MKTSIVSLSLSFLMIICFGSALSAQSVADLQADLNNVKTNLELHHKQFKTGTNLIVAGIISASVGSLLATIDATNEDKNKASKTVRTLSTTVVIVGSGLSLAGWIVQLDSHKYFKRAAMGFTPDGLTLKVDL